MTRPQPPLLRHWKTVLCLATFLLAGGCARNVQKTGNLPEPKDQPLAVDWKYLRWPLDDVFFIDTKHGWGVAEEGLVLATQDGGLTWERRESGTQSDLNAVWFVNGRVGWIVGDQVILSTQDGGLTWAHQSATGYLTAVHFINEKKGWAVGYQGVIRYTADGGRSWEPQKAPMPAALNALQFVDADTGWAVGEDGAIIATRNGGRRWISQESHEANHHVSVFFLDRNNGWISTFGEVLQTKDGGAQWIQNGWPLPSFIDLHFTDSRHGVALAFDPNDRPDLFVPGAESAFGLLRLLSTKDGGESWSAGKILGGYSSANLRFIDREHGYVFDRGSGNTSWIDNSGKISKRHWEIYPSHALQLLDSKHGWGLSSEGILLLTRDGGVSWNRAPGTNLLIGDVHFLNLDTGWAITEAGALVSTTNGGLTWNPLGAKVNFSLNAIHFVDTQAGWAVGDEGVILKTEDGGLHWIRQQGGAASGADLYDVVFLDREHGWAAGDQGVIVATSDGGKHWAKQTEARKDTGLNALAFANTRTGWATGYRLDPTELGSLILMTQDGGRTWREDVRIPISPSELSAASFDPNGRIGIAGSSSLGGVTQAPFLVEGRVTDHSPWVRDLQVEEQIDGSVLVSLHAWNEHLTKVQLSKLEFLRPGPDAEWGTVQQSGPSEASPDGLLTASWNPGEYQFDDGDLITYRVTLSDDAGLSFTQEIQKKFTYRSRWNQPAVQGAVLGGCLLAAYAILCLTLLGLSPLALLWIHQHVPLQGLIDQVPGKSWGLLVSLLLNATGLPALARHPRTRRAWETRYRIGHAKFSDLSPGLRASYVEDSGCLDAWVERRAAAAKEALMRIEAVHKRSVYIELPVRDEDGKLLPAPMPPRLRELFARERTVLVILGEGGAGKSTLACQIARWTIADDPASRLSDHRMIPIFLEEETTDLVASATGQLRSMVGTEETEPDIVLSLLRSKRLLIVMDALSECTPATQSHVEKIHQTAPVNALIVTARRPPDFGPVPVAKLWPLKITPDKLVYFLVEYLRRTGNDDLFPDRQGLQLADRLLGVVERGGQGVEVTPLLVKLFVDQAIKLRRADKPLDALPTSIAETMLDSLRHTNPDNPEMPNRVDNTTLILAARVLGRCSLEHDFIPRDFERKRAETELVREKITPEKADVIARLIDNGVLYERSPGGTSFLRFTLDPLAEYLAAIDWLATHGSNKEAWQEWMTRLRRTEGYPEQVRGFLVAFQNCLQTYRSDFKVPDLDFEDEELRGSQDGRS